MKKISKVLLVAIAFFMLVSCVNVFPKVSHAKTTTKKLTMTVGDKKKWYIFGTSKKPSYKSSNKKIASVSKKGIITAKKKGKCTITAKVSGRTFKYKVTVKKKVVPSVVTNTVTNPPSFTTTDPVQSLTQTPAPTSEPVISNNELAAKLEVNSSVLPSGRRLYTITNKNSVQIYMVKLSILYNNAEGISVKSGDESLFYLDPAETRYVVVSNNVENADYSKTITSVTCTYSKYSKRVKAPVTVTAQANPTDKTIVTTIVNPGSTKCTLQGVCLFKDAAGTILDAREIYVLLEAGETKFETIREPYSITTYDPIEYTNYELIYYADAYVE